MGAVPMPPETPVNHFMLLRPSAPLALATEEQVAELRAVPGVHLARVSPRFVSVHFAGDEGQLQSLLAGTSWSSFHMSRVRQYRLA
jgi:hypothetical protein